MNNELINTKELANRTDTACITWAKRRMLGEPHTPKFIKIGRSVKYRWSDVEEWLDAQTRNSTSEVA